MSACEMHKHPGCWRRHFAALVLSTWHMSFRGFKTMNEPERLETTKLVIHYMSFSHLALTLKQNNSASWVANFYFAAPCCMLLHIPSHLRSHGVFLRHHGRLQQQFFCLSLQRSFLHLSELVKTFVKFLHLSPRASPQPCTTPLSHHPIPFSVCVEIPFPCFCTPCANPSSGRIPT